MDGFLTFITVTALLALCIWFVYRQMNAPLQEREHASHAVAEPVRSAAAAAWQPARAGGDAARLVAVLGRQIGRDRAGQISYEDQVRLTSAVEGDLRGRPMRDLWESVLPAGTVQWSATYTTYLADRKSRHAVRLTDHQLMLEPLIAKVVKHWYLERRLEQSEALDSGQFVVFECRAQVDDPLCNELHGRYWPESEMREPLAVILRCPRASCWCDAPIRDWGGLLSLRAEGVPIRSA